VPELVVIVGPIASGKSTVAGALGRRFMAAGRAVAVLDLDDVVDTIGGFGDLTPQRFRQAQVVHGQLVGAWLRQSFDVIAHGPSAWCSGARAGLARRTRDAYTKRPSAIHATRRGRSRPAGSTPLLRQKPDQDEGQRQRHHDDQHQDGVHPARPPYLTTACSKPDEVSLSPC
jgi:hypothetical protein